MIVINMQKIKMNNHQKKKDIKHIWVGKHTGLVDEASKGVREQVIVFLPLDVVANMLSRLSVRSLVRFRCVCKQWRSLISDPIFIKEQRIRALARPAIMSRKFAGKRYHFMVLEMTAKLRIALSELNSRDFPSMQLCHCLILSMDWSAYILVPDSTEMAATIC